MNPSPSPTPSPSATGVSGSPSPSGASPSPNATDVSGSPSPSGGGSSGSYDPTAYYYDYLTSDETLQQARSPVDVLTVLSVRAFVADPKYVSCVFNSGFVDLIPESLASIDTIRYTFLEGKNMQEVIEKYFGDSIGDNVTFGPCRPTCLQGAATGDCCAAAKRITTDCIRSDAATKALGNYANTFDAILSLQDQCAAVSVPTISLWAIVAVLAVAVATLVIGTKRLLWKRQNGQKQVEDEEQAPHQAPVEQTWFIKLLLKWRQVSNLVWKNMAIKRTKPVAMVFEVLTPMILMSALSLVINAENIFNGGYVREYYGTIGQTVDDAIASSNPPSDGFMCTTFYYTDSNNFGVPSEARRTFYSNAQSVIGLFVLIIYIKFVSRTTAMMVIEKESRIHEIMKIMGLSDLANILSWVLTTAIFATPLSFAMAALLKYTSVFPNTSYVVLVWLLFAFIQSITAFSYFIAPFFRKSRTAAIASVLAWIVLFFPYFAVQSKSNATKLAASLAPPTALGFAVDEMLRHAQMGTGTAYNMASARSPVTVPSAFALSWLLVADCVVLYVLGWYVGQVLPQEHGVARAWHFVFHRSFWLGGDAHKEKTAASSSNESNGASTNASPSAVVSVSAESSPLASYTSASTPFASHAIAVMEEKGMSASLAHQQPVVEPVTGAVAAQERNGACLQIHRLRKVFDTDGVPRVAVADLSLTMYAGQITALLGHNGAGKTTTISMLTGLTPPTDGDAMLFGRSIRRDFDELRQMMGICPQHDVLLSELTVEDHLLFFGTMKHVPPHLLADAVETLLRDVGLVEKRRVQTKNLSGGQKRKLSVAIAFIGGSKLVFLDEPTSGMDPYSRRFTWDLLQRHREDRVIVLTTHFMDEADILGDRIAIMADGQLRCVGSSLFLKNRFGAGYTLTMLKTSASECETQAVLAFVQRYVSEARCLSDHGAELVFQLPTDSLPQFPGLLESLDAEMVRLGVSQYGMSVTTLEEVFLKISQDRVVGGAAMDAPQGEKLEVSAPSLAEQFSVLFQKRVRITRRDRKSLINAIGIPLMLLVIAAAIPEIQVASFLPQYALTVPPTSSEQTCVRPTEGYFVNPKDFDCASQYTYCSVGVYECDAAVCCNEKKAVSPYFACNDCKDSYGGACYNPQCLDESGARGQIILNSFLDATIVTLAFAFIPAAIVAFIVREKDPIQNAKMLQLMSGARPLAYWLANAAHDMLAAIGPVIVCALMVPLTSRGLSSIQADEAIAVVALLVSHMLAVVPMAYVVSHRYVKHSSAQTALLVLGLVSGGALSIVSFLCRVISVPLGVDPEAMLLSTLDKSYLRWIYLLFPSYALNSGMHELAMHRVSHKPFVGGRDEGTEAPTFFGMFPWLGTGECAIECWDADVEGCCVRGVFALDVVGAPVLYGVVEAVVFALLLWWLERRSVPSKQGQSKHAKTPLADGDDDEDAEDSDVAAERERVQRGEPSERDTVWLRDVRQQYPDGKVALQNLNLAIDKGECFGYLGINGAGKSTTMKILTGQVAPSSGSVRLGGFDLATQRDDARSVLGYCPQFDSLHDLLTVTEQLELYARLKGIKQVEVAVADKIAEFGLGEYRDKLTRGLSGGNKRKLSTAIALMGAPRVVLLDEPSTGVDPSARRQMWDVIARVCAEQQSSVVLTTHSMEECEALATRVGILVDGALLCLGSVEHLKQKFGTGYTIEVKLSSAAASTVVDELVSRVGISLGGDVAVDRLVKGEVVSVCEALGDATRGEAIMAGEASACSMAQVLENEGHLPVRLLCEWWASEDAGKRLVSFVAGAMTGSELVEQQGADHFRFQVPKQSLRLGRVFRVLEEHKAELGVHEYSVSDTTLEHIFNSMAGRQDAVEAHVGNEQQLASHVGSLPNKKAGRGAGKRPVYRRASSSVPII